MANDPASLGGPFSGATPSEFFVEDDVNQSPYGPTYAGGKRGGLADYYRKRGASPYASRIEDPFYRDWANRANADQLSDRSQLMDAYKMAQAQGAGGVTPQQQAMQGGFLSAAQNAQNAAVGARGGAYGRSAANASLTQSAGIQGAHNQQMLGMQKAADQMAGQQRQLQIATQLRAQDLQDQGLTADDAMNRANQEVQARGMNMQRELGYAGLEGSAISGDYQQFLAALRRRFAQKKADQAQTDAAVGAGVQAGSSIAGAFASDKRVKREAFADGMSAGRDLAFIDQDPNYQLIGSSRSKDLATYLNKRTGQVESVPMGFARDFHDQPPRMISPTPPEVPKMISPERPLVIERKNPFAVSDADARALSAQAQGMSSGLMGAFAAPSPLAKQQNAEADQYAAGLMGALRSPSPIVDRQAYEMAPATDPMLAELHRNALARSDLGNAIVSDERAKEQAYLSGKIDGVRETTANMQAERDAALGKGSKAAGELGVQKYAEGNVTGALQDFRAAPPSKIRDAQIRIASEKVSPNAASPKDARVAADRTLDALSGSQSLYSYTHPAVDTNPNNPGAAHLGVMAQDLEGTPVGSSLVQIDPRTGLRTVNAPAGLSAAFAGLGRLNERLAKVERR